MRYKNISFFFPLSLSIAHNNTGIWSDWTRKRKRNQRTIRQDINTIRKREIAWDSRRRRETKITTTATAIKIN